MSPPLDAAVIGRVCERDGTFEYTVRPEENIRE